MGDLELNVNAYLPLRDVVFETLRDAILKGIFLIQFGQTSKV